MLTHRRNCKKQCGHGVKKLHFVLRSVLYRCLPLHQQTRKLRFCAFQLCLRFRRHTIFGKIPTRSPELKIRDCLHTKKTPHTYVPVQLLISIHNIILDPLYSRISTRSITNKVTVTYYKFKLIYSASHFFIQS